jgi:hypothetical protein
MFYERLRTMVKNRQPPAVTKRPCSERFRLAAFRDCVEILLDSQS